MAIDLEAILSKVKNSQETKIKQETTHTGGGGDPRVLTLKKGCKYYLRLLPRIVDGEDATFVSYKDVGFTSQTDGTYVFAGRSLSDADPKQTKNDLIKKVQWEAFEKAKKANDEDAKKASYKLIPSRKELVNAYLIKVEGDDQTSKEKEGTVVIFRYPAGLDFKTGEPKSDIYKLIYNGILGEKSSKIGKRAFDLTDKGRSLIIEVTEKGGWNNYSSSSFDDAEDIGLTKEQITKIYASTHDLNELVPAVKSNDEIQKILDEHWFGTSASPEDEVPEPKKDDEDEDEVLGDSDSDDLDDLLGD